MNQWCGAISMGILSTVLSPVLGVIDKFVLDKDKANELKVHMQGELLKLESEIVKEQGSIIRAEANGQSWLQRNWRPILMLVIVAIVANNFLIAPILQMFGAPMVILELPSELYDLMTIGVGGYIVGRSGEKIASNLRK